MTHGLATDAVLLVVELWDTAGDGVDVRVIQRSVSGSVQGAIEDELDVLESEGLGLGVPILGVEALTGPEEPEETDDQEVDKVALLDATFAVSEAEDNAELAEDVDVDRVGA